MTLPHRWRENTTTLKPCRVCDRHSTDQLDPDGGLVPVCNRHGALLRETVRESVHLDRHSRAIGYGVGLYPVDETGEAPLRCDRSTSENPHTWTGVPGAPCMWCLALYVETLREEREIVLSRIDLDPDDSRYSNEVLRRGARLLHAQSTGLVSKDEALATYDRWAAHV